jgi:3-oxosteroid 1-dehydrogenase
MSETGASVDHTLREDLSCDVAVVGSGGGGLVAALRAADLGLDTVLLERSDVIGGTTAVSGGVLWAPNHDLMEALGVEDSAEAGAEYLRAATKGGMSEESIAWFVDAAPKAVRYLHDETRCELVGVPRPDYHSSLPGASRGRGVESTPLDVRAHEGLEELLRTPTYFPPMTIIERDEWQGGQPDFDLLKERAEKGVRTLGGALVGRLILSLQDRGVRIYTDARARRLAGDDDGVDGVEVETDAGRFHVTARRGVVLASGGFEWSEELQKAYLPAPVAPTSPPHNEGDGLKMGLRMGAAVKNMSRVWGVPVIQDPEHIYDDAQSGRVANVELTLPGAIAVNRHGERFVNEATNYHDLAKVFTDVDPADGTLKNQPAWMVFDARYRRSYPLAGHPPGDSAPEWVATAPSLAELAEAVGIDPEGLEKTVVAFNAPASEGVDPQFGRGEKAQDRHLADKNWGPNPSLAPLTEAPYYAVPIRSGTLGTAGGLSTDDLGRVLGEGGTAIPGLFAAGNVTANLYGDAYPGAGATITAAVVRGYAIGDALAADAA